MFDVRIYKIKVDLTGNLTRTILIVLSIAVGLFALGTILSTRTILEREMDLSYRAINPSSGTIRTVQPFDLDFVESVRHMDGVAEVDARRVVAARVLMATGEWANLTIYAIEDYDEMRINLVFPQHGAWPPPDRQILIERAALGVIHGEIGDRILVETPNKKQYWLPISGTVHDPAQMPAQFDNSPYGYISFATLEWFGEPYGFNELYVVADNPGDQEYTQQVVNQVKNKAEKIGYTIPLTMTAEPGQIPLNDILDAVMALMGALGLLSLMLSALLIINTVTALLAQQKRQIGVIKALGASSGQVIGMYLFMVVSYGFLALLLSVPFSMLGAQALSRFVAGMFNFNLFSTKISPAVIIIQVGVGLLLPVLASLAPFLVNLRISAAQAMSVYQISQNGSGKSFINRFLAGANLWFARNYLKRPLLLSLRNTFRARGRLALTLTTLTLASATFIGVVSLRSSLYRTIDDLLRLWSFDSQLIFSQPYRIEKIEALAKDNPNVIAMDTWIQIPARRVRPDGDESNMIYLFAPRPDSDLARSPELLEGRWLLPEDENALVVSTKFLEQEPDTRVGDLVTLTIEGKKQEFQIVGLNMGFMMPMVYANYSYIAKITGRVGEGDVVLIRSTAHSPGQVMQISSQLEQEYEKHGLQVVNIQTTDAERSEMNAAFGIIVSLLLVMSVLLALVGGLGLMGTMTINILERRREIGVLRAIGASSGGVSQVFILEGVLVGLLSWAVGAMLSIPLGMMLSNLVGQPIAGAPLSFSFSLTGLCLWLGIIVLLSTLASAVPSRNASRLTVREVLAYE